MHWEFESSTHNGLKVIPEIPQLNPCLIEGRNGIGKTVAVQLIQLASGDIPSEFQERPDLWRSMRERLGDTRLKVQHLTGAETLRVQFTPENWPDTPDLSDPAKIATASIDGAAVPLTAVWDLIHVDRIAGNEDLSRSIERHRALLETQLKSAGDRVRAREREVREVAGELISELERVDPAHIDRTEQTVRDGELVHAQADADAQAQAERLELTLRLIELERKQAYIDEASLGLLATRDEAAAEVRRLEAELQEAQVEADRLAEILRAEGGVSERFGDLSELLRKRKAREARETQEVAEAAKRLDVNPDPAVVATEIDLCNRELDSLESEQRQLDSAGELRELLDVLTSGLNSSPLHDQLLADGYSPELTVAGARSTFGARRATLANVKTPAEARGLVDAIQQATSRRDYLSALSDAVNQLVRTTQLREAAQSDYDSLEVQMKAASENTEASRAADATVGAVQQKLLLAHEALATTSHRLSLQGTISQQDADREVAQIRDSLGLNEGEGADPEAARRSSATADTTLESSRQRLSAARRNHAVLHADLRQVSARLMDEKWLATVTGARPLLDPTGEPDVDVYRKVREAVLRGLESLQEVGRLLAQLEGLCRGFFDTRPSGSSSLDEASRGLRAPFEKMLARRLLDGLGSSSIRSRLFDGGEVTELDPTTRTLTIRHSDGREESRPMSSYSTGEQAFAFTQARILDIPNNSEPNTLLVLDEFGAFVSADRMPDLADFLASEPVRAVADQVIVILPLQVNYETEIENTTGNLRARYESRLEQIRERGYCAVELT